jgi:hypothetical protein
VRGVQDKMVKRSGVKIDEAIQAPGESASMLRVKLLEDLFVCESDPPIVCSIDT